MDCFVLMADIKESRKKDSKNLMADFRSLKTILNKKNKKDLLSPLTITLGDEFQGILGSLKNSIKLIIQIEELIIDQKFDFKLRYVLNYGKVDTKINHKIAYEMLGSGLTIAREKLNSLKKSDLRYLVNLPDQNQQDLLNNAFIVYQSFVDDWKIEDYKIVREFINNKDYKEVSEIINFNISSAWRREKSLRMRQYFAIKSIIFSISQN